MDDCQHSFDELKCLVAKQMVLGYPDFTIPFEIYMDASNKLIPAKLESSRPSSNISIGKPCLMT
jgi:hypothetical protein